MILLGVTYFSTNLPWLVSAKRKRKPQITTKTAKRGSLGVMIVPARPVDDWPRGSRFQMVGHQLVGHTRHC